MSEPTQPDIEALIEASSLGTPEAKAARESVPHSTGVAIALAAKYLGRAKDAESRLAAARAEGAREAWKARMGSDRDDLLSRLGCIAEATHWDRPYDERIAAIRGMCDLTTNGMTPEPTP